MRCEGTAVRRVKVQSGVQRFGTKVRGLGLAPLRNCRPGTVAPDARTFAADPRTFAPSFRCTARFPQSLKHLSAPEVMQVHDALNSLIVADDHDGCDLPALEDQQRLRCEHVAPNG